MTLPLESANSPSLTPLTSSLTAHLPPPTTPSTSLSVMPGLTLRRSVPSVPALRGISAIPVEIWDRIVSHLSPPDKRHLGSVCRSLNRLYWHPERTMWRVPISDIDEGDLEWAEWVFLESQTREALQCRLALPDVRAPTFIPGEPGAYANLVRLEIEVFLGGGGGDATHDFDAGTFIRDVCSYHRVAPNLRDVRIHVDVRARDLALLYRSYGLEESEDWRVPRRTSLFKADAPPSRITTVVFHQLSPASMHPDGPIPSQINQLLACLPPKTVGLVTAPLTATAAAKARRGGYMTEKVVTAIADELDNLHHIADESLKSLSSLVMRRATPWCARNLLQLRFPRLVTVALPVPRAMFERFIEPIHPDPSAGDVRLDMMAGATHRGIERLLLLQDTLFPWHLLYHVKLARQVSVSDETSLAQWPHDFVATGSGTRSNEQDEAFPHEDAFDLQLLRPFADVERKGKRGARVGFGASASKRAKRA